MCLLYCLRVNEEDRVWRGRPSSMDRTPLVVITHFNPLLTPYISSSARQPPLVPIYICSRSQPLFHIVGTNRHPARRLVNVFGQLDLETLLRATSLGTRQSSIVEHNLYQHQYQARRCFLTQPPHFSTVSKLPISSAFQHPASTTAPITHPHRAFKATIVTWISCSRLHLTPLPSRPTPRSSCHPPPSLSTPQHLRALIFST